MKERSPKSAIFLVFIIVLVSGSVTAAFLLLRTDTVGERVKKSQFINVLFTVHEQEKLKLIDVFLYNPETKKGSVLYLPNSTWLMLEALNRYDTLETLYSPGNPGRLIEKIERMINVKIPYYIDMDSSQLGELVDLMAGLEVFIASPIDKTEDGRRFLFESGNVVLDGDKVNDFLALDFQNESDMEKAQRRQDFLKSLIERLIKNESNGFLAKPDVFPALQTCLRTNFTAQELRTFLSQLSMMNLEGLLYRRAHGTKRAQNDMEIFIPNDQGEQLKKTMGQAVEFLRNSEPLRPEDMVVKLEILNGTEIAFRARDSARIYKKYGYEVLREDNAPEKPVKKTVVIYQNGNQKLAREIGAVIKCFNIEEKTGPKTAADITIIIGMDFDGQYCQ